MKRIDLSGKRFGKLTVQRIASAENGIIVWECLCDCGNVSLVRGSNLRTGAVKSCGCSKRTSPRNRTHGESQSKLYRHWKSMIYRCTRPSDRAYKWYGGRGIKVCDEWQTYEGFKDWVQRTRPDETYTVERVDVDGDYCPGNCTWIPMSKQANNRTSCVRICHKGVTKNLTEWCRELGLEYKLVHNRMFKLGWDFERAISTAVDTSKQNKKKE